MEMTRIYRLFLGMAVSGFFALNASCTRSLPENVELKISVPTNLSSLGGAGTLANEKLEIVILNLRASPTSPPVVAMYEVGRELIGTYNLSSSINLTIAGDRIPQSKATIVQYIGVYKDDQGKMIFSYGDTVVNTDVTGIIAANITSTVFSSGNGRQVKFGGRYLTSTNAGPTGSLITYFQPPDVTKPLVAVERSEMIDGYFAAFALEGTANANPMFTFKILDHATKTETAIWTNVNSSSTMFTTSDPNSNMKSFVMEGPVFAREQKDGAIETRVEAGGWLHAGNWSTSVGNLSGSGVIVSSTIPMTIDKLSIDQYGLEPYSYDYGNSLTIPSLYYNAGDASFSTNNITFYPGRIDNHGSEVFGFNGVFSIVNPDEKYEGAFLKATKNSDTDVDLNWDYLPLSIGLIDGAEIYYKYQQFGGDGGDHGGDMSLDKIPSCQTYLSEKGFVKLTEEASGDVETVNLSGTPGGGEFDQSYGYRFAVCPFKVVGGVRQYYRTHATTSCFGSCGDHEKLTSFGKKVPGISDIVISTSVPFASAPINGKSARIMGITDNGDGTFDLAAPALHSIDDVSSLGDELLIKVMGSRTNTITPPCGQINGNDIGTHEYDTATVVGIPSADTLTVKPSRPDFLGSVATYWLTNAANTPQFCYIQMVRVPHFGNVTLDSASSQIIAQDFNWDDNGGGIIAMRINGKLDIQDPSAMISASAKGYPAGSGQQGEGGPNWSAGSNATSTAAGSGGGGAHGNGGAGETNSAPAPGGMGSGNMNDTMMQFNLNMGSGGGNDEVPTAAGGRGGGIVIIMARQVLVRSGADTIIEAKGAAGTAVDTFNSGGGGGGGAVNLYSINVRNADTLSGLLKFAVSGGGGGFDTGEYSGGGGGGGYVKTRLCDTSSQKVVDGVPQLKTSLSIGVTPIPALFAGGLKGGGVMATDGLPGFIDNSELHPMCRANY